MRPHYSHSNRENATPSSGTSLLASCKGVLPSPHPRSICTGLKCHWLLSLLLCLFVKRGWIPAKSSKQIARISASRFQQHVVESKQPHDDQPVWQQQLTSITIGLGRRKTIVIDVRVWGATTRKVLLVDMVIPADGMRKSFLTFNVCYLNETHPNLPSTVPLSRVFL